MPEDDHKEDWLNKLRKTASDMMAAWLCTEKIN